MNVKIIKTSQGAEPMTEYNDFKITKNSEEEANLICIFPDIKYQTIQGFGGAFTEASAVTYDKLSKKNQEKIIKLYFDKNDGIGYNLGRVHINSCDFSLDNYSCVEENDNALETFNLKRDKKWVIPMIKDAKKYSDISFIASPWSPPAFMKTNGQMNQGGKLKEEYFDLCAVFYEKFINAYKEEGINIDKVTVQNEPKAVQVWDSCVYTAEEERDFVKNYLGKKMQDMGIKIFFWDHNKERIIERAKVMLSDKEAADYIDGIAFHWYSGDHFEQLDMFNKMYPDKSLVFTEGCYEYSLGMQDTIKIGEKYAHDIIGNFNNYCNAFCDWNLLLDEKGGPNHVGNFCDSPIMADVNKDEVYIHDSYYYIGHFSKFVKKGARRIGSSKWTSLIDTVSFENPDGSIVTVVLNATDYSVPVSVYNDGEMINISTCPHSIYTIIKS